MKTKTDIQTTETMAALRLTAAVKRALALSLAAGLLCAWSALAAEVKITPLKESLSRIPAAEMPAKAAEMVKVAKARDRGSMTVEVTLAAFAINPAAVSTVVGAISKAVPDMAANAASTAAEAQPKKAAEIARAAALAAPARTGKIVAAVCRAVPSKYRAIALAVAEVVPAAGKEILLAVASAIPSIKPEIDAALANHGSRAPSVRAVLETVKPVTAPEGAPPAIASSGLAPGHVSSGGSLTPTTIPPSVDSPNPGPGPRGQRNYAAP